MSVAFADFTSSVAHGASAIGRRGKSHELPSWPQFATGKCVATHQGRQAIYLTCRALLRGADDEALMPSYNCGTEVDAVRHAGARVRLYRVDERTGIDLADIQRRTTPHTRIVYVIHYFGWPQDLTALSKWCRERGLYLIEDCALGLFSGGPDSPVGSVGDAAVFSLPKTLSVPDGGVVVHRNGDLNLALPAAVPERRVILRRTASLLYRRLRPSSCQLPLGVRLRRDLQVEGDVPDMPADYYITHRKLNWRMSSTTRSILKHVNPDQVIRRRRANYMQLLEALRTVAQARPLFDSLPSGVCPIAFPIRVSNRALWMLELRRRGVAVIPWWAGYHRDLSWTDFAEARRLKNEVLAVPIHQDLRGNTIGRIADCIYATAACIAPRRP
jgi:perosamine synthetase